MALSLLHHLRHRRRTGARLLGVGVSNLVRQAPTRQGELFGEREALESERDRVIARAVDRIHDRFGRGALQPARIVPEAGNPPGKPRRRPATGPGRPAPE